MGLSTTYLRYWQQWILSVMQSSTRELFSLHIQTQRSPPYSQAMWIIMAITTFMLPLPAFALGCPTAGGAYSDDAYIPGIVGVKENGNSSCIYYHPKASEDYDDFPRWWFTNQHFKLLAPDTGPRSASSYPVKIGFRNDGGGSPNLDKVECPGATIQGKGTPYISISLTADKSCQLRIYTKDGASGMGEFRATITKVTDVTQ